MQKKLLQFEVGKDLADFVKNAEGMLSVLISTVLAFFLMEEIRC